MRRIVAPLLMLLLLCPGVARARSGGVTTLDMLDGPGTCSHVACHGSAAIELVAVEIRGPDQLEPGETTMYSIRMMELAAGGLQVGTGINLALFLDGDQMPIDPQLEDDPDFPLNLQVRNGEITHAANTNLLSAPDGGVGVFVYDVPITAPSQEGTLVIMATMNSFNQNFNTSGDHWSRADKIIFVPEPTRGVMLRSSVIVLTLLHRVRRRPRLSSRVRRG
jgi:hypothetical protein